MDGFVKQQQTIDREWDQFHREFDRWRAGLTACHRSSVHEALQDFAAGFASVTKQARDLPRTAVTRELADILIAAAEEEEAAFRQLRDRWQPDNLSLFELVEQRRSDASRAQKEAEDRALELQEQFEKDADPEEREALEEFSDALDAIKNDWNGFHDDYAGLRKEGAGMDAAAVSAWLEELIAQFGGIVGAVDGLPSSDATESMIEMLQEAAEAERETMFEVNDALVAQDPPGPIAPPLDQMDAIVEESEDVLKEVSRTIKTIVDDDPEENLAEVKDFNGHLQESPGQVGHFPPTL